MAGLLRYPYDWSALQAACQPSKHYIGSAEINRQVKAELKKHKGIFGSKREAKRIELREAMIAEARRKQELLRQKAWNLHALAKLYERHRDRIQALPPQERPEEARKLVSAYVDPDPERKALQKLEGLTEHQIEQRKTKADAKRRAQFIVMTLAQESRKLPRRPVTRMLFPQSAANPIRAIEEFRRDVAAHWQEAVRKHPDLGSMAPQEAAAIVLSNTKFLRMDEKMWHSRKATSTKSDTERKD